MTVEQRLEALRGVPEPRKHNARTVAALAANPGCARRAVLDAAGVDKRKVAAETGFPAPFGQSQFAITREAIFHSRLMADDCAELVPLLRERLGLGELAIGYTDLAGAELPRDSDVDMLLDRPMVSLNIGGQLAVLDSDLLVLRAQGRFHVVEIKSFPIIDGQADAAKAAAASIQAAVHVHALRQQVGEAAVAHEVVLVCPEDFSNRPTTALLDVRKQLTVLRRQLVRLSQIESILDALPGWPTPDDQIASVQALPARYAPSCLSTCEMCYFCRDEAAGTTATLGAAVREQLGGVETAAEVLALAHGEDPEHAPLQLALRLRTECLP